MKQVDIVVGCKCVSNWTWHIIALMLTTFLVLHSSGRNGNAKTMSCCVPDVRTQHLSLWWNASWQQWRIIQAWKSPFGAHTGLVCAAAVVLSKRSLKGKKISGRFIPIISQSISVYLFVQESPLSLEMIFKNQDVFEVLLLRDFEQRWWKEETGHLFF